MTRGRPALYGQFQGGPDPLAPRVDAGAGVDDIGKRILAGESVQDALRDMLRSGSKDRKGLGEMSRKLQERKKQLRESGSMDGLLSELRAMLESAVDLERSELFRSPTDEARFSEVVLDALPNDVPRAMAELSNYSWMSSEAAEIFRQMQERLRKDVIDQQFAGLSESAQSLSDPTVQAAMANMMRDLNELLEAAQAGKATDDDYKKFIEDHKDFFPNAPDNLAEFIDELARQSASLDRMLASMTPEQRAELSQAMQQALTDMGLQDEMAKLQENLKLMRPEFSRQRGPGLTGEAPLGLPDATRVLAELADVESLISELSDAQAMSDMTQIDFDRAESVLGRGFRDDLQALEQMQRELVDQGYLIGQGDSLRLSPKAIRRIGQSALREVFKDIDSAKRGDHENRRAGSNGEVTGAYRDWQFGEDRAVDMVRTVQNASRRRLATGSNVELVTQDFAVSETETLSKAAIALLVDQSSSMLANDTWGAAKTMALALNALTSTSYPLDALQVIGFADLARVIDPTQIPDLKASEVPGTNLQHALMLAGRFLDHHPTSQRIVMVVTDGEPTAHLLPDGRSWFDWPPSQETISQTVFQVDAMTRRKIAISWFRLGDEPRLARFLDEMARRNGGKVLAPATSRLGDFVISDYMRTRSRAN